MNAYVGKQVLARCAVTALVVMTLLVFVLATRLMLSGLPLSLAVLGLLCVLQFPQVVTFACGLGTWWFVDDWVRSEAWALISTTGVSRRQIAAAVLAPGVVVALWMMVFNVTVFRKASIDGTRAMASVQLEDSGRALSRAGVLQVGAFRLLARDAEGPTLHGVLSAFDSFAIEATEATFGGDTLVAEGITLLKLDPPLLRFTASSAQLTLSDETTWTWGPRLASDARGLIRALTLALSIPVSMWAAVLCASLGRRLGRLPAFVLWAALGAGALFGVSVALASSPWWQLQPLGPPVVFLGWALGFWRVREA